MSYDTYQELHSAVEGARGLLRLTMGDLRDIEGPRRLGPGVNASISAHLAEHGLGHLPAELPLTQDMEARLFLQESVIADLVSAVLSSSSDGDEVLRRQGSDDSKIVMHIRTLLDVG